MAKAIRLPPLEISLGQIVGQCVTKDPPDWMARRELTPKEKQAVCDFINKRYRPLPSPRKD